MNNIQIKPIIITLDREVHSHAQYLAAQQTVMTKKKQAYLNALSLVAVHNYLRWLQIENNLPNSDNWQPIRQLVGDGTSLFIPNVGRLECCRVLPSANYLTIPPTTTEANIGYIAVQFTDNLDRLQLIGFLPEVLPARESRQIPLTKLQPLELLLTKISSTVTQAAIETEPKIDVNLDKWWSAIFEPSWLGWETLLPQNSLLAPGFSVRTQEPEEITNKLIRVRRGKLINLGAKLGNDLVTLVITCAPTINSSYSEQPQSPLLASEVEIDVLLQVYPVEEQVYLPANLELMVSDENNTLIPELSVKARDADNCIQLCLSGYPGERFSVTLSLKEISFTENFQL